MTGVDVAGCGDEGVDDGAGVELVVLEAGVELLLLEAGEEAPEFFLSLLKDRDILLNNFETLSFSAPHLANLFIIFFVCIWCEHLIYNL